MSHDEPHEEQRLAMQRMAMQRIAEPDLGVLRERAFNLRWAECAEDVIPLTAADPDLPVAQAVVDALGAYLASPHLPYGPACGLPAFRGAVAAHYSVEKAAPIDAERVIAANSAASAISLVAKHLIREGDEVVVQDPVDFLVSESARRAGATIRHWAATDGRFTVDGLRAALTPRTRVVSVCHPHNPTGTMLDTDAVRAIAILAAERGCTILSDEVWSDVLREGARFTSFASTPGAWVVYGLSKGYALAGLRIGAVIAPDAGAAARFASECGFDRTIEGAATLSQVAAIAALRDGDGWRRAFLAHCTRMRTLACERLRALHGLRVDDGAEATFVLWIDARATTLAEDELAARIERHARVRVVPGSPRWFGPGAAGHIRISLATSEPILSEAIARIAEAWPTVIARDPEVA